MKTNESVLEVLDAQIAQLQRQRMRWRGITLGAAAALLVAAFFIGPELVVGAIVLGAVVEKMTDARIADLRTVRQALVWNQPVRPPNPELPKSLRKLE